MIKPKPLQALAEGGFTVGEKQGTVSCPAGHTVHLSWTGSRPWAPCAGTARCASGAPPPRPAASSSCTPRDDLLRQARAAWTAPTGLREDYMKHRPNWNALSRRSPPGGADQAPLPRGDQEPRLAQAPHRLAQPAEPHRERAGPPGQRLGSGHLTRARPWPAGAGRPAPAGPRRDRVQHGHRPVRPESSARACRGTVTRSGPIEQALSDQGSLRSVRDFARKEWPLRGSPADVRCHAVLRSACGR